MGGDWDIVVSHGNVISFNHLNGGMKSILWYEKGYIYECFISDQHD